MIVMRLNYVDLLCLRRVYLHEHGDGEDREENNEMHQRRNDWLISLTCRQKQGERERGRGRPVFSRPTHLLIYSDLNRRRNILLSFTLDNRHPA